jgi:hypothetical protein
MQFDPDEIAQLSPAARVEVQDFYARKFLAEREAPQPDRRAPKHYPGEVLATEQASTPAPAQARPAWPRVWFRNDSSRPTSFPHQWPPPFRARGSVHVVPRTSSK